MAPSKFKLCLAFAAVYLIWGSTYLAIKYAIETLPPFLMAGTRFLAAGSILYAWTAFRGVPPPKAVHWKEAFVIGAYLLLIGNGAVVWAAHLVPSGLTSLLIAMEPIWVLLLEAFVYKKRKVNALVFLGAGIGFSGVALLVSAKGPSSEVLVNPLAAVVLILGSLSWAYGSIYTLNAVQPESPLQGTALKMIAGGILLCLASLIAGEARHISLDYISLRSALSYLYLIIFGSIVAFSSYIWILKVASPSQASTYAFVNPVVAVILGWAFAGEKITPSVLLAGGLIVVAIILITRFQDRFEVGVKT